MGVGVAISKDETYKKFTRLTGAMAFALMGRTRGKRDLRDRIALKMSEKLHMSNSVAISMFPYMEIMFENDDLAWDISNYLLLEDDEIKRFRKRKIPKSVVTRKEKEREEELAIERAKYKNSFNENIQTSPGTLAFDSNSNEELNESDEVINSSKSTKSSKPRKSEKEKINDKTSKETEEEKQSKEESREEESREKSKEEKSKEEKSKEVKKDNAQKSLFNF